MAGSGNRRFGRDMVSSSTHFSQWQMVWVGDHVPGGRVDLQCGANKGTRHQNEGNQESKRPRESQSTRRGTRELGIVKRARGDELLRFMDGASKEPLRKVQPYSVQLNLMISYYCSTVGPVTIPLSILHDIRDLKVAKEEQDIGFYAGFVGATYFLGRAISAMPWGMFADKYGRKPCIVISILSVIVFNTLFGLSTTYWMAIVTRGLLGLLCGILGPIKVTSSRAIALVIGPAIGGFLAQVKIMEFR
ncbi:putative peptide/nitrate transporter [Zea mays]|uniref:Putative peptide/nitrate transporter n=1 Tax=Zea mays TaxID=4577 RepID=A0A1D6ISX7_MAIZE|nr:putative peptide/nitrate transporter [Zea mays]AQK39176.1 putative peptide/nitrate transporter [Zea mays]